MTWATSSIGRLAASHDSFPTYIYSVVSIVPLVADETISTPHLFAIYQTPTAPPLVSISSSPTMSASVTDMAARRPSAFNAITFKKKNDVDITLNDDQNAASVHSYTTLDRIEGTVSMKFDKDTHYDALSIFFEGTG